MDEVSLVYNFSITAISDFLGNIDDTRLIFGADFNNNNIFEAFGDEESVGILTGFSNENYFVNLSEEILSNGNIDERFDKFLSSNSNYFINILPLTNDDTSYSLELDFDARFTGEIDTNDSSYCCDEDQKYYYDDLTGLTLTAGQDGLSVGDTIDIEVTASGFEPVIFISNNDTGEVIELESNFEESFDSFGIGIPYVSRLANFEIADNTTYLISVETAEPGQTGEYVVDIEM